MRHQDSDSNADRSLERSNACNARAAAEAAERAASKTASGMVPPATTCVHTSCEGKQATCAAGDGSGRKMRKGIDSWRETKLLP